MEDNDTVRQIDFDQGKISATSNQIKSTGDNSEPANPQAITFTFKNNSDAFKIVRALKKEKEKIFEFIQEQRVKIEGDFSVLQTLLQLKDKLDNS